MNELPELTFELATSIGTFPPFAFEVSAADLSAYRRLTATPHDDETDDVPPGFAAVFGRLGYLRAHRMPPGGVLLGQDIEWVRPATVDRPLEIGAEVVDHGQRGERRSITFLTTACQDGDVVCRTRIKVGWPK